MICIVEQNVTDDFQLSIHFLLKECDLAAIQVPGNLRENFLFPVWAFLSDTTQVTLFWFSIFLPHTSPRPQPLHFYLVKYWLWILSLVKYILKLPLLPSGTIPVLHQPLGQQNKQKNKGYLLVLHNFHMALVIRILEDMRSTQQLPCAFLNILHAVLNNTCQWWIKLYLQGEIWICIVLLEGITWMFLKYAP